MEYCKIIIEIVVHILSKQDCHYYHDRQETFNIHMSNTITNSHLLLLYITHLILIQAYLTSGILENRVRPNILGHSLFLQVS